MTRRLREAARWAGTGLAPGGAPGPGGGLTPEPDGGPNSGPVAGPDAGSDVPPHVAPLRFFTALAWLDSLATDIERMTASDRSPGPAGPA